MRLFKTSIVTTVLTLLILAGCTTPAGHVVLPEDVKIVPPSSDLPPEVRAYSGKWHGVWDQNGERREHILVVERIDREKDGIFVRAIYSWGDVPSKNKAGCKRVDGEIDKDNTLKLPDVNCDYQLQPDGTLKAHWWNRKTGKEGVDLYSTMRRLEG